MLSKEQVNVGMNLLAKFLKGVDIKVNKTVVLFTQKFDFGDETLAKSFAKRLAETYGGTEEKEKKE